MTVNLSPSIEAIAKSKAAQAGIADVDQFVERLIENSSPEQALLPSPNDPRIAKAIAEGLASGIEGPIDDAFWAEREAELEQFIASRDQRAS